MTNFTEKRVDQIGIGILVALAALTIFLLANTFGWAPSSNDFNPTITVMGEGRAFAVADTATFSYTLQAEGSTAAEAQELINEQAAAVSAALKQAGVEERDIKTQSYNVFPRYEYRAATTGAGSAPSMDGGPDVRIMPIPGGETRVLVAYEATQTNSVRVRTLEDGASDAGNLLTIATNAGASSVSNLDFVVWDETLVDSEARANAIDDAKIKAKAMTSQLGVRLGDIVGFDESGGYYPQPMFKTMEMDMARESSSDAGGAEIALGENEVRKTVNITFKIK